MEVEDTQHKGEPKEGAGEVDVKEGVQSHWSAWLIWQFIKAMMLRGRFVCRVQSCLEMNSPARRGSSCQVYQRKFATDRMAGSR